MIPGICYQITWGEEWQEVWMAQKFIIGWFLLQLVDDYAEFTILFCFCICMKLSMKTKLKWIHWKFFTAAGCAHLSHLGREHSFLFQCKHLVTSAALLKEKLLDLTPKEMQFQQAPLVILTFTKIGKPLIKIEWLLHKSKQSLLN